MNDDQAKVFKMYILENLDFSDYDDISPITIEEKIRSLESVFMIELGFMVERVGRIEALKEWLQGLPSVLNTPYKYIDIEELFITLDIITVDTNEDDKNKLVNNYWHYLANQITQLFSGYRIPKV